MSFNSLGSGRALTCETRPLACRNAPPWPARPSLPPALRSPPAIPLATQPLASGPLHPLFSLPGTLFLRITPTPRPVPPRSLPRPLLQGGCLREKRGSICEPDLHTFGWATVLEKSVRMQPGSATCRTVQLDRCVRV